MRNKNGEFIGSRRIAKVIASKIKRRWFVVANRVEAVIYSDEPLKLAFVKRLSNPKGKLQESMLDSDKPGRGVSSAGEGTIHHSLDRTFKHHEQAAKVFATHIAEFLETARREKRFAELVLVSEPRFLGLLRAALPLRLKALVKDEVNREFSQGSDVDFRHWYSMKTKQAVEKGKAKVTNRAY